MLTCDGSVIDAAVVRAQKVYVPFSKSSRRWGVRARRSRSGRRPSMLMISTRFTCSTGRGPGGAAGARPGQIIDATASSTIIVRRVITGVCTGGGDVPQTRMRRKPVQLDTFIRVLILRMRMPNEVPAGRRTVLVLSAALSSIGCSRQPAVAAAAPPPPPLESGESDQSRRDQRDQRPPAPAPEPQSTDQVVARVNGRDITMRQLQQPLVEAYGLP